VHVARAAQHWETMAQRQRRDATLQWRTTGELAGLAQ
jgi:hypothetical protein